jgi:Na+-driven multidrug efflux pump
VGLCVNVALGLFLVPVLGAKGAALSAMGSYWVSGYLTSWIFPRLRECGRMQTQAFLLPFRPAPLVRALLRKS